jgi:hypothetical protein
VGLVLRQLDDKDIEIFFDDRLGIWYLEAFGVKQYLAVKTPSRSYGRWHYKYQRRKDFLEAGKRAQLVLNQRLIEIGKVE